MKKNYYRHIVKYLARKRLKLELHIIDFYNPKDKIKKIYKALEKYRYTFIKLRGGEK